MQILSSGSFINLENQEKIEQLIFTAREIAQAAVETDGFVNQEENNRRLALEIWQGAEYMCRDHEEANVKNIFINNFLERLRELGAASKMPDVLPENSAGESSSKPTDETTATRDEFLGFVGATEFSEQGSVGRASLAQENSLEAAQIDVIAPINNRVSDIQDEKTDEAPAESDELSTETASEIGTAKPEGDKPEQMSQSSESEKVEEINVDNSPKHPVGAIVLPEKEPYRWSSCTVRSPRRFSYFQPKLESEKLC